MPVHVCPECGAHMGLTRAAERPDEDAPALPPVEGAPHDEDEWSERDLAAEDVDPLEPISVKAATLVCQNCGCVLEAPDL